MRPQRLAHYCCRCNEVFYSTSALTDACSRCGAANWDELKKYKQTDSLFGLEGYEE